MAASHAMIHGETADLKGSTAAILCAPGYANTQQTAMTGDDDDDDGVEYRKKKKGLIM